MAFLLSLFILHFFVPQALLDRYFKTPYFSDGEIQFFTGGLAAYIRTVMFMRLVVMPVSGKKRSLMNVHRDAPRWFVSVSRILLAVFYLFGSGFAVSCIALLIHSVI